MGREVLSDALGLTMKTSTTKGRRGDGRLEIGKMEINRRHPAGTQSPWCSQALPNGSSLIIQI